MSPKRLYRDAKNKVFGGVAGGLGDYFAIDPVIIRILFVALTFAGGTGLFLYILFWIALPEKNRMSNPSEKNQTIEVENDELLSDKRGEYNFLKIIIAVLFIIFGLILLLRLILPIEIINHLWPLIFIVAGVLLLTNSFTHTKR